MRDADWTYELPRGGEDTQGIEGYNVERADGELVGVVAAVVERAGVRYVLVQHGSPLTRDLEAVPLRDVVEVDHTGLAIRLRTGAEADMLALDPARGVEGGRAEGRRVLETGPLPPRDAAPTSDAVRTVGGYVVTFALGLAALFALIVVWQVAGAGVWMIAFLVPLALIAAGGALGYRFIRYHR